MTCQGRVSSEYGLTLIELLIALIVFSVTVSAALGYMRAQSVAYRDGSERARSLQNLQFATGILERDIRTAGSNVPDAQPILVYAGVDVVAFNSDYTTNVRDDVWAVYYDPDAPSGAVTAMDVTRRSNIPHTTFAYPDTSYLALGGAVNSPAETIVFYFELDDQTPRADDYVLFRVVNGGVPELVARDLLQTAGESFFDYLWLRSPPGAATRVEQVPASELPLKHSAPVHGGPADTAAFARIDSVRAVRVNFTTTNGRVGEAERTRSISRLIWLPNAGLAVKRTCGDAPILGVGISASGALEDGEPVVNLSWGRAVDEGGGESDATRYVIWRRAATQADWGDPYLSIPAGQASYVYTDMAVVSGERFYYALAVQDCTPMLSALATTGLVIVP